MNENGQCTQIFTVDTGILRFLYYEEKNVLITITDNLMLTQHAIMPEGDAKELMRVNWLLQNVY